MNDIGNRHKEYESCYDYKITRRIPIIIRVDGKGFSNLTRRIEKPYCPTMLGLMAATMHDTIVQMDGAVFGYQQSDEISFILRNDQSINTDPWYGNRVQKLSSITASLVTLNFNKCLSKLNEPPNLIGNALFDARVFAVPNESEAINNLIFRQQDCIRNAVQCTAKTLLLEKLGNKQASKELFQKNLSDQLKIIDNELGASFEDSFPTSFRRGVCIYKSPKIIKGEDDVLIKKNKWSLDFNTPDFIVARNWLTPIIQTGYDVYRSDRDSPEGE